VKERMVAHIGMVHAKQSIAGMPWMHGRFEICELASLLGKYDGSVDF